MKTTTTRIRAFRAMIGLALGLTTMAFGANPDQGTINPGSTAPLAWDGNIIGASVGGPGGEASCVDGTSCDVFTIHLPGNAADYAGVQLLVEITFSAPQDYDLFVHKDTLNGKVVFAGENGGPPGTSEQVAINPATSGAGDYVVHILYGVANPAAQYHGTAKLQGASAPSVPPPPRRTANYVMGGITFSNNVPLKA